MKKRQEIHSVLEEMRERIDGVLEEIVPLSKQIYAPLQEAMRYATLGKGKRIRPLLCLCTAETFGVSAATSLYPACALELIHAYSMVHDDLPCMDDDDFRRGKPTVHKKHGEWQALLAGDALLTEAFRVLARSPGLSEEQRIALINTLAELAGQHGMVGGQYLDLAYQGQQGSLALLEEIHCRKTGALFAAALHFGAILGGVAEPIRKGLSHFGYKLGLAFQLVDDIGDVVASEEKHGSLTPSDISNGTCTSVSLVGVEETARWIERLLSSCEHHLDRMGIDPPLLEHFVMQTRSRLEDLMKKPLTTLYRRGE